MKILLITETYPPDLDPGALSVGKLVKACTSAGHRVVAVTTEHDSGGGHGTDTSACWGEIFDHVVRIPRPVGKTARVIMGGAARVWSRLPAIGPWAYAAYRCARALVVSEGFDCVVTGYIPFRTAPVGHALKEEFGIPWFVRFPDPSPWCLYPAPYGPGRPVTMKDRYIVRRMKALLKNADALITPSERMAAYINDAYEGVFGKRQMIVPHVGWARPGNGPKNPVAVQILHPGIMMHGRESEQIALTLRHALEEARALGIDVRVTFTGYMSGEKSLPRRMKDLDYYIEWTSPVPYEESLAQMSDATALLLVEAVMREGIFLPSKVADYAVSGKPVLMFSPEDGTVADLVGGRQHPGFLTQDPDLASKRLVEFLKRAAARCNVDAYQFPRPFRFHPKHVVGSFIGGIERYSGTRAGSTTRLRPTPVRT